MKQTHPFHKYMWKREILRCRENRVVQGFPPLALDCHLTHNSLLLQVYVCVCVCTVLCTKRYLALSGLSPQDANKNFSLYSTTSCDNQKCLVTLPNEPWDAKLSPLENNWVTVFVIYCCVTNYPSNLVSQNNKHFYLTVTMGWVFESDLVGGIWLNFSTAVEI